MEKFPELKDDEVALLRADFETGQVLDELFVPVANNGQKIYTIFDGKDKALQQVKLMFLENKHIECIIYGKDEDVICYVTPQNIASYH